MLSFKEINKIGNPYGISLELMPNYVQGDDSYPKYGLFFQGTEAKQELGQGCYYNGTMKGVNEDFQEVLKIIQGKNNL